MSTPAHNPPRSEADDADSKSTSGPSASGRSGSAGASGASSFRHPREAALFIVRTLQQAGHIAYFAGGCVRDELMGRTAPDDYDIATDARPEEVRALFHRTRAVGEHFGVMLVDLGRRSYEVATFRTEWGYSDFRRPDQVTFSDAEHDARRRDFTINGLFKDPIADRVIDYVGGRDDLARGVIRAIGDPHERLNEDHLRALRAVRFAARFQFEIDPATSAAIVAHAFELRGISRERIGQEIRLMLSHPHRSGAMDLLEAHTLDVPVLDVPTSVRSQTDGNVLPRSGSISEGTMLGRLTRTHQVQFAPALAAWTLDRGRAGELQDGADARMRAAPAPDGPPDEGPRGHSTVTDASPPSPRRRRQDRGPWSTTVDRLRRALVLSNEETQALRFVLVNRDAICHTWASMSVAMQKRLAAEPLFDQLLQVLKADDPEGTAALRNRIRELSATPSGIAPAPLLTGDDLIAAGFQPSPRFRHLLDTVYDAQLEERVKTRDEALAMARNVASSSPAT